MAKISLRMYNREIEGLVERAQQLDEAIAHCRQILKTYPKYLETYRLLGKAYLEAKRYDQAVDIFQRVLVAAPDDFVSHVGMSIIADDKGKLDDAIWHMERAFEVQPSNAAIQGELQRLFGRRDGVEPPKIRLTRGALAHMYVQGELYNQAISEIRAVLASDPKRTDMQTLLARAYFRNGQKAEATDICTELLAAFPYCLDANRLMVEILPGTQRADSAQEYRDRVIELDPYAAFAQDSLSHTEKVPDSAVSLERLEYTGPTGEFTGTLGIGLDSDRAEPGAASTQELQDRGQNEREAYRSTEAGGDLPSWLSGTADDAAAPSSVAPAQNKEELPEFLRHAGWDTASAESAETAAAFSPEHEAETPGEAAVEGDLPEWVRALAPTNENEPISPPISPASPPTGPATGSTFAADTPDWLRELGSEEPTPQAPTAPTGMEASSALPMDAPDWLRGLSSEESTKPAAAEPESVMPVKETPSALPEDVPDWLRDLGADDTLQAGPAFPESSAPQTETPSTAAVDTTDWLRSLDAEEPAQPAASAPESNLPAPAAPETPLAAESPDWLRKLEAEAPADTTPLEAEAAEDTPDWLKALAGHELDEPTSPATPSSETDIPVSPEPLADESPAWLKDFSNDLETPIAKVENPEPPTPQPPAPQPAAPQAINVEPAATLGSLGTTAQEQDDAMAWLEGLAAKHGAKPEELVTDPNARTEVAPDWVDKAKEIGEQAQEAAPTPAPTPAVTEPPTAPSRDETGIWLRSLEAKESETITPKAEEPETAQPESQEFQSSVAEETAFQSVEAEPKKEEPSIMDEPETTNWFNEFTPKSTQRHELDDAPDWLRGISNESEEPESSHLEQPAETSMPASEAPTKQLQGMPEWPSSSPAEVPETASETSDLPAWLAGLDEEEPRISTPGATNPLPTDDLPAWLQAEAEPEPQATQAASPADWKPAQPEPVRDEPPVAEPVPETPIEEPPVVTPPVAEPTPAVEEPITEPLPRRKPEVRAPVATPVAVRPKPISVAAKAATLSLGDAQSQLGRGNIAATLDIYTKLIRKGKSLEEIIRDLRDALYRYPVEVPLWQSLGDAYMRANRLQEALDAYTKAEELLR